MKIALTGATGFVGQSVLDEAAQRGLGIRALTRREQALRGGVEWVRGDLHDMDALARLVSGADAVLHVAGVVNAPDVAGFHSGNVTGTQNVIDAAVRDGPDRLVAVSSLSAREPALSDYGHSKRLAEERVQVSGMDWTLIRPPAIYGPRDTEMFDMFRAARVGVMPLPPAGRASIVHVGDLARLLLDSVSARSSEWSQKIFEPDDGREEGWAHRDLAQAIGAAMGRNVWSPAMPAPVLKLAARIDIMLRGNNAKLTPDRARYMVHPDWVADPLRKVPQGLWQPAIGTREGLAETARWYAENGWLRG